MRPRRMLIAATAVVTAVVTAVATLALTQTSASAAPSELLLSEYVEGSSNNKAIEIYNGTGAAVTLGGAAGYVLETYSNGNPVAGLTIALNGTVADGDVWVVAHASANAAILAQADQTTSAGWFNGNDAVVLRKGGAVVDSIGQVGFDPGTQWGTGLTSTMDNTLRRKTTIEAGDTDPSDVFDPAVQWDGFANDTFDGLGAHSTEANPVTLNCGPALTTSAGTVAVRTVTATDADDVVVNLDVTAVNPAPAAGSISRTALTPATEAGGTASAEITVDAAVPSGTYAVTVTSTDADGGTGNCLLTVTVTTVLTVGEVQGQTTDAENGKTDRSPRTARPTARRSRRPLATAARARSTTCAASSPRRRWPAPPRARSSTGSSCRAGSAPPTATR